MAEEQPEIDALFTTAIELASDAERAAYLKRECRGDEVLRRRLEKLLVAHFRAGSFLESPVVGPDATGACAPSVGGEGSSNTRAGPGTVIGPYKLLEQIGEGGMGTVWMAQQTEPVKRLVAVKLIKPGMDSKQVIARFEAERQALALMDHPNIAKVLDGGTTKGEPGGVSPGRPYFVMDRVKGVPITRYCDEHHLTPRQRLELFVPVCQAVQHAHQKGIIHRDLKPSNVLVAPYDGVPVPKVIDFGVAKAAGQPLTDKTLVTGIGAVVGTLEYMSPEQAELNNLDVDTRSDIYSLGVLLYELLTGTTPLVHGRLKGTALLEALRLVREEEPPRPSTRLSATAELPSIASSRGMEPQKLRGVVRGELDWIVMKCLEKNRSRRYETASSLAKDVERYLADEPVQACPPSAAYRFRKFARRNKGALVVASAATVAVVLTLVILVVSNMRITEQKNQREAALHAKDAALAIAHESKRDADVKLFESYLAQARANRLGRRPGQRFETLDILRRATALARTLDLPAEKFLELRNAAIAAIALPDLHLAGPWISFPDDAFGIDFDEKFAVCARTDRRGGCSIRRVTDDTELHFLPGLGRWSSPCISRDGKFVAVMHHGTQDKPVEAVDVWQIDGAVPRRLLSEENARFATFWRDDRQIALAYNDGTVRLFELPSGRQKVAHAPDPALTLEVGVALHPTESVVAVWSYHAPDAGVQLRDLLTGKVFATLPQPARPTSVAWHPDGHTFAVSYGESNQIRLYDRTTLRHYRSLELGGKHWGTVATFNRTGDRLSTVNWGNACQLFDVGTGQLLFVAGPRKGLGRFSQDGDRLAAGLRDGKIGTWQVADGREYRTLIHNGLQEKALYQSVSLSRDGRRVAGATSEGFGLWDLASGAELAFISMPGGNNRVLIEPSGALLTLTNSGLLRWPVGTEPERPNQMRIGPPERLPLPYGDCLAQSQDGRVIVTSTRTVQGKADAGGWILRADQPNQPIHIEAGTDIGSIAVSPDGRWVVTATHDIGLTKVWDARDGRFVTKLTDWAAPYARFTADGRWLATAVDGGRLFAVETWKPGPQIRVDAMSPDGAVAAVQHSAGFIRLIDPATGQELATLEGPNLDLIISFVFTREGDKLIGFSSSKGIHVWDLRLIRRRLAEMGQDWDAKLYSTDEARSAVGLPTVEVRLGDISKSALTREQRARRAIEQFRAGVAANPDSAGACNALAWTYLSAPESLRDVKAALPLAEKAVRLEPGNAVYRNTLGVGYYRAGRYREAVDTLRPNLAGEENWALAFDLYFLAMSHYRLGETTRARDYFDWAVRWPRAFKGLSAEHQEELADLRAEAEKVLGIAKLKN